MNWSPIYHGLALAEAVVAYAHQPATPAEVEATGVAARHWLDTYADAHGLDLLDPAADPRALFGFLSACSFALVGVLTDETGDRYLTLTDLDTGALLLAAGIAEVMRQLAPIVPLDAPR